MVVYSSRRHHNSRQNSRQSKGNSRGRHRAGIQPAHNRYPAIPSAARQERSSNLQERSSTLLPETYCNYQSNWNFNQQRHGSVSDSVARVNPMQITPKSTPREGREWPSPFRTGHGRIFLAALPLPWRGLAPGLAEPPALPGRCRGSWGTPAPHRAGGEGAPRLPGCIPRQPWQLPAGQHPGSAMLLPAFH